MYDLFVSYAHADDRPQPWVRTFTDAIKGRLGQFLPREAELWRDYGLEAGNSVPHGLNEAVSNSQCILIILSPRYLASEWCRAELGQFLRARGNTNESVFVVEAERTNRALWPQHLRDLKTVLMWRNDPETEIPERLGYPQPSLMEGTPYWKRVNELSHFISRRLTGADQVKPPKGVVWIAQPTDELAYERDDLAGALRQAGWEVAPAAPYPTHDPALHADALRRDLDRASLCVQLLGRGEGVQPGWGGPSFPVLQANQAEVRAKARGVRSMRWADKATVVSDSAAAQYKSMVGDGLVYRGGFEEFKQAVLRALEAPPPAQPVHAADLAPPPAQVVVPQAAEVAAPQQGVAAVGAVQQGMLTIYVHADTPDAKLAEDIQARLDAVAVESIASSPITGNLAPAEIRRLQLAPLMDCDGVIVVYGHAQQYWVQAQFAAIRKAFAQVRPPGRVGVLTAPPTAKPPHSIRSQALLELDCSQGIEDGVIAAYIARLRAEPNVAGEHV